MLAVGAAPAAAVVAALNGHGYGITPIRAVDEAGLIAKFEAERSAFAHPLAQRHDVGPLGGTQLVNAEDGPVMHSVTTHAIYWDPNGEFTSDTKGIVDGFFSDLAHDSGRATNVFAIAGQYTDSTGNAAYSVTAGDPKIDSEKYPETLKNAKRPRVRKPTRVLRTRNTCWMNRSRRSCRGSSQPNGSRSAPPRCTSCWSRTGS